MTRGLVVMAYGTPASPDEVEAYYTHIRRGRPPTPDQLADLQRRYAAIGGVSPLAERTRAQADAVAAALDRAEPGGWRVVLGMKHAAPFVEDAVAGLAKDGASEIVGLVLAPHWSRASVGEYHSRAAATATDHGARYTGIERWHDEPAWRTAVAGRVRDRLAALPESTRVLFTAHSLPERVLADDPYADELLASATAVARDAGLDDGAWSMAWQSAGRTAEGGRGQLTVDLAGKTGEAGSASEMVERRGVSGAAPPGAAGPWRGPDVLEVIAELGAAGRVDGVLVCPQGFVSDHLEVLYDLDVDAARVASEAGLAFARTASIDDDPAVMGALADRVRRAAS